MTVSIIWSVWLSIIWRWMYETLSARAVYEGGMPRSFVERPTTWRGINVRE